MSVLPIIFQLKSKSENFGLNFLCFSLSSIIIHFINKCVFCFVFRTNFTYDIELYKQLNLKTQSLSKQRP